MCVSRVLFFVDKLILVTVDRETGRMVCTVCETWLHDNLVSYTNVDHMGDP